jgi:hypothetical protein
MVERFFPNLTQNWLRRGVSYDPEEVIMSIGEYIDKHKVSRLIPFFPVSPDGSVRSHN